MNPKKSAFTLIELLVVIVIIGILATIGIAQFNTYQERAREAVLQAEVNSLQKSLMQARITSQQYLVEISGRNCTYCNDTCVNNDLRNVDESNVCFNRWKTFLDDFMEESGIDLAGFYRDPWGSPYLLDENEHETTFPCRKDWIKSAGPDGVLFVESSEVSFVLDNRGFAVENNDDNLELFLPFFDMSCNQ